MSTSQQHLLESAEAEEKRSLGYLGMIIFLGSWAMMFGALFFAYAALRLGARSWPPPGATHLPLLLPGISTTVILASSVTLQRGMRCVREGRTAAFAQWLLATIAVGTIFLCVQVVVWSSLWAHGLRQSSGSYGAIFYTMTVFHFLHVVVGLGMLCWLLPSALRRSVAVPYRVRVRLVSMFWHFVSIVWVAIYLSVYVF